MREKEKVITDLIKKKKLERMLERNLKDEGLYEYDYGEFWSEDDPN